MKGFKTHENAKFLRFFELVQRTAEQHGAVFFLEAGDGNEFETAAMEGETLMGWLIPKEQASVFETLWQADRVDDSWSEKFVWAVWKQNGTAIEVQFE